MAKINYCRLCGSDDGCLCWRNPPEEIKHLTKGKDNAIHK